MVKKTKKNKATSPSGIYQVGLNRKNEAVISAHFMHDINQHSNFNLYSSQEFTKKAAPISSEVISERLLPLLIDASDKFIAERVCAAKVRAKKNYKLYGLHSSKNVDIAEMITEVMFDRQFIKGPKLNSSRLILVEKIRELISNHMPVKMVILALPYKSSSPLKCRGEMPDLAEINFLLSLSEIAKTIDYLYRKESGKDNNVMAGFTVISDGRRFNTFLNEDSTKIEHYQNNLRWWIKKLDISAYIEILDYQNIISNLLPKSLQLEKSAIREHARDFYTNLMAPLLDPYHMSQSIIKAIECDPEPERSNPEGRYIPLFKSLIYIVKYVDLLKYANLHNENYATLYKEITKHIFEPYTKISPSDFINIEKFISDPQIAKPSQIEIYEYFRQSMLRAAWHATIDYMAEIRSDRDLPHEPIITCFPDHIRWTIHAKPGQLAILTTTAFGDPVQPWHGVGVFKKTKHNKIKLYTLPVLSLEGINAIPITVKNFKSEPFIEDQPLFYVDSEIKFDNIENLLDHIHQHLTRKRTW